MKKLLIFDGNSIVNRAFYGVRLLTNKEGLYTNAIYGFLNILLKYLETDQPDYLVIAFDLRAPTFRHKQFEGYKAQRKGMPEELASQMPVLKEVLAAMNIAMVSMEGYEADDLIGTVASWCEQQGVECHIATGDRDSLQLASETTRIYLTATRQGATQTEVVTPEAFREKYGTEPARLVDIKGLMGDSSDNIPGVAGIGEKTAVKLIGEYGSIDGVYENLDKISGSVKTKLENGREAAFMSRGLAKIDCQVPLEAKLEDFARREYNGEALAELLSKLEFKSILNKLSLKPVEAAADNAPELERVIITDGGEAKKAAKELLQADYFSFALLREDEGICAAALMTAEKYYFFSFGAGLLASFGVTDIREVFEGPAEKYGHRVKEDLLLLKSYGVTLKNAVYDTSIAAYILDCTRSSYDPGLLCGFETEEAMFGKGKKRVSPAMLPVQEVADYGYKLAAAVLSLKKEQEKLLREREQEALFYEVEMPLCFVLAEMEETGFKIDKSSLREFGESLSGVLELLEKQIFQIAGMEFNVNSTRQLGEVLFDRLKLPVIRKTKTGYSTDSDVLERLSGQHEIIGLIKEYRTLTKLKSTYADGLIQVIDPADGKIHSKFNQTVTATGRISSTEPNLQNIPVRMEIGREIRKMFVPESEDYVLLDADYSQVELRILAHISKDEVLTDAFLHQKDIHAITASQVFGIPLEEVTSQMRTQAKAVNFGIVYGISDFALAGDLKITRKMARQYIDSYLERYPKVKQYMAGIVEQAKETGYVTTILNRRRYIPELKSQKYTERSFGERVAMNTPVQGSAADVIKVAMVKVHQALKERGLKSRLLLQVHDELIVEACRCEAEEVSRILKENMEQAVQLSVPLTADVHEGENWYEAKG